MKLFFGGALKIIGPFEKEGFDSAVRRVLGSPKQILRGEQRLSWGGLPFVEIFVP